MLPLEAIQLDKLFEPPLTTTTTTSHSLSNFISNTFVYPSTPIHPPPILTPQHCTLTMSDLLSLSIARCLRKSSSLSLSTQNIITFGYRLQNGSAVRMGGTLVEPYCPNPWSSLLVSTDWCELHRLIGDEAMFELIGERSVFIGNGVGGYIQISGRPFSIIKEEHKSERNGIRRSGMMYGQKMITRIRSQPVELVQTAFYAGTVSKSAKKTEKYMICIQLTTCIIKKSKTIRYNDLLEYYCPFGPVFSDIRRTMEHDQKLVELRPDQVTRFVMAVLKRLLPTKMKSGYLKALRYLVVPLIELRRFEVVFAQEILKYVKIKELCWFVSDQNTPPTFKSKQEHDFLTNTLINFTQWLIQYFILPLLRHSFYVTEASDTRHCLKYYRHEQWQICTVSYKRELISRLYELAPQGMAAAPLRLLPKPTGFRPIVNLNRRISDHSTVIVSNIDCKLRDAFDVLNYFRLPRFMGSSVLGLNEVHDRLHHFKSSNQGPFYLVKADISNCFDSIPHDKLLQILSQIVDKTNFIINTFDVWIKDDVSGKTSRKVYRQASPASRPPAWEELRSSLLERFPHALITDRVISKHVSYDRLMCSLRDHLLQHYIRIDNINYRQTLGIPQGSILSSLLCALFYGHLDSMCLGTFDIPGTLILRYTDDFLLITDDKHVALDFITYILKGFPEYGVKFKLEKALTNFSHSHHHLPVSESLFPWIGLLLDPCLNVHSDYNRIHGTRLSDTLTIHRTPSTDLYSTFSLQMKRFLRPRLHRLLRSSRVNVMDTLLLFYMRATCYRRQLQRYGQVLDSQKTTLVLREVIVWMSSKVKFSRKELLEMASVAKKSVRCGQKPEGCLLDPSLVDYHK